MTNYRLPPGPPPLRSPWAAYFYLRGFQRDPANFVKQRFDDHGDIYYAPLPGTRLYVTRHPEHIRDILIDKGSSFKKTETGIAARHLRRFLGSGLLLSNGELWRRQRRMINPSLHRKHIESYASTMVGYTERTLSSWRDREPLDLSSEMMRLTLAIVTKTLFDHGVGERDGEVKQVMNAMETFRQIAAAPAFLPSWLPLPGEVRTRRALAEVDAIIYRMVDERRTLGEPALSQRSDLLSSLILATDDESESGDDRRMTRKLLRDELLTLFLAGHETTSHALTWTFYLLSQHASIARRLYEELDTVLQKRPPTVEDLRNLPFTERVVNEAMRLYPPAPVVSRTAIEDVEIGGYTVPAGAEIVIWIYWAHRDPRWFPEPDAFVPDRFAPDAPPLVRGSFLPFGGGTRLCIGKEFAMMEARLILATVAQRFHLQLYPDHKVEQRFAVTMSPRYGMRMIPQLRNQVPS